MRHDEKCERSQSYLDCCCGSRAYKRDPYIDEESVVEGSELGTWSDYDWSDL